MFAAALCLLSVTVRVEAAGKTPTRTHIITKYLPDSDLHARSIDTFLSGTDFFAAWKTGMYDLIFLDIYLKDCLGIDIARQIRESDKDVLLVFCTTSNEFASESYGFS